MNAWNSYSQMNSGNFDWSLVRSFLAALEHGSLLAAARATGTSQPTLGRHIAELESQWAVVLFERTGRGLQPTARALQLAQAARAMDAAAAHLGRLAGSAERDAAGVVRLSASQPVACWVLPSVLAGMRDALPRIDVELVVSNALSNLLAREADIALRMVRPQQASLVARRIGQAAVWACAHRDYLGRRGIPVQPTDLLAHDLIGSVAPGDIERGAQALGVDAGRLRFALRTDDLIAQWQAVRAGIGVAFLTDHVIATDPQVQRLLPQLKLPRFPMWLVVHREIRTSARIRAVYDYLAAQVPALLAA